jgi:histidinol dehydrogenase
MRVVRYSDPDFGAQLRRLTAPSSLFDHAIEERAHGIIDAVRERGDVALIELTERFDGFRPRPEDLAVTRAELLRASVSASAALRAAVTDTARNVSRFAQHSLRRGWHMRNSHGAQVGEKFDPLDRVGVYIPGGQAPLVSTALMTISLARVAGCREIAVCTPADRDGAVNPALLFAASAAGATEIFRVGGAQAIAAMAYGTATIRHVQKIFGPGNAYVVAAKRLLFGHVGIDLLPGPSELLVLADATANPRHVAADLLAQAEHGSGLERVWAITTSARLLRHIGIELRTQAATLERRASVELALRQNGWLILTASLQQAIALANQLAPEHCEIMTRRAKHVATQIRTAGAIFLGPFSPTVLGDYVAGPSHVLPTGGAGAAFGGLTVDQFQRRTSIVEYDRRALARALPAVTALATVEGLGAHARSATIRLDRRARNQTPAPSRTRARI